MKTSLVLVALTAVICANDAAAQARIRSDDYHGSTAIGCYDWKVGFAFEECARTLIPGSETDFAQVYTLADGSVRRLTEDPGSTMASADAATLTAATDTSEQRVRFTPREGVSSPVQETADSTLDQLAAEPISGIVEEEFTLPPVVLMLPGKAEIIPMAVGHLNRIETPFKDPAVRTSAPDNALNVEFDGRYVYVSLTQPVTLFLHERGHPEPALVISLVPKRIAPRQVRLTVPSGIEQQIAANAAPAPTAKAATRAIIGGVTRAPAPRPKEGLDFVAYMGSFIDGHLPFGFTYGSSFPAGADAFCQARGVRFTFDQGAIVYNRDYVLVRGMATSRSPRKLEEVWCARQPGTIAVAYSPRLLVGPNSPVDFFVLLRGENAPIKTVAE